MLANRHVAAAYGELARGAVELHEVRSYRAGDRLSTRLAAMLAARALPARAASDVPRGLDVVHYPVTVPIPRTDAPTVVTVHDLLHHEVPGALSFPERRLRRWSYDESARSATVVATVSEHAKATIVDRLGIDPGRVEVVHHGIDHERFTPNDADDDVASKRLALPSRFVLYPANIWPHKNHERLLEGLAACDDRDVALVLTGETYGRLRPLLQRARELGVDGRVTHLGYVPAALLPVLYRRASAVVFPSLFEGFGTPPLEAMACGCPVACSMRASLAELCGDAVLPLDPESPDSIGAAIEGILSDEPLRSRLRSAGIERAASFTWIASAARHRAIYARAATT